MSRYTLVQFSAVKGSSAKVNEGQTGWSPFHHVVTYVTREVRDDMDAATRRRFA